MWDDRLSETFEILYQVTLKILGILRILRDSIQNVKQLFVEII